MAKNVLTTEFRKFSDNFYFDENVKEGFGYGVNGGVGGYTIGGYLPNKDREGLSVIVNENQAIFSKYHNGIAEFPIVKVYNNGDLDITIRKEGNVYSHLKIESQDGSFLYYQSDFLSSKEGNAVSFDGISNKVYFRNYKNDTLESEESISKKFPVENAVYYDRPLNLPKNINASEFKFNKNDTQTNNTYFDGENGIDITTFIDGTCSIGAVGKSDPHNLGRRIYQENNGKYFVAYMNGAYFDGPVIAIGESEIWIYIDNNDDVGSSIITLSRDNNSLIYFDCSEKNLKEDDAAIRIKNFSEISFSKYTEKEDMNYSDYFYSSTNVEPMKEPRKEETKLDKNDPEVQMMNLVGQEDAKKEFRRIKAYIQKNETRYIYKNIVFFGENGVGKSTVAKLIAKILYKYDAISSQQYVEASAKELLNDFTGSTTENLKNLLNRGRGGVILIDDVHHLDELNSSKIREGLFSLSNIMSENPDTVFILCDNSYNLTQILENNRDLFSDKIRFRVNFRDFTREELCQILETKIKEKGYTIEDDAMKKLLDIIYLSKSYGNNINARAALSILEEVIVIQNVRTEMIEDMTIINDDIDVYIAENDIAFIDQKTGYQSEARKKLDELVGLDNVKDMVDDLIAYFSINRGKKVDFHMAFLGNPGTGKTEVARIIGKLLHQEGILGTTKFLEVTRKDLIGQWVGHTAVLTRDIIGKAMGGVLYIDEAYSLAYGGEHDFGPEAIAELLKAMEDRRGEFCVILAGYTKEMQKLFDLNPGFKSRIKFELEFPDYSDADLEKIARMFLKRDKNIMSEDNLKLLVKLTSLERSSPNFANVRSLRENISRLQIKHARRVRQLGLDVDPNEILYEDIVEVFGKELIDSLSKTEEKVSIPVLNPAKLKDFTKNCLPIPFDECKNDLTETILSLKMTGEKQGEGTGFLISEDGYFLTCNHCVSGVNEIKARRRIMHHNKKLDIYYDAEVVCTDKKADVALCRLKCEQGEEFDYLILEDRNVELDKLSKVYLLGYPFGVSRFDELSINEGKIASYQQGKGDNCGQINLDIQAKGGNSGSPVLDGKTSRVIGVFCGSALSFGSNITEEINYCRPIDYVYDMLEKEYKGD